MTTFQSGSALSDALKIGGVSVGLRSNVCARGTQEGRFARRVEAEPKTCLSLGPEPRGVNDNRKRWSMSGQKGGLVLGE